MEERLDALYKAISTFDHEDKEQHNLEIKAGADVALVKMLAFLEFKLGFRRPPIQANLDAIAKEISLTCHALEMVYRASSESVEISFFRVGTDLLQILVVLIEEEVKRRTQRYSQDGSPTSVASAPQAARNIDGDLKRENDEAQRSVTPPPNRDWSADDWDRDLMLRKVTKILGHYARVGRATSRVAHFPGLLGGILNLVNLQPFDAIPWESRLSCLWVIANLACDTENMMMMICTPGLVNSLVNIGFRQVEPMEPIERTMEVLRARSIAARALVNLSWPPENKIILAENTALVSMLSQLALKRKSPYSRSKTMIDILAQTRRYAVAGLRNLAAATRRSKITLCELGGGQLLDTLTDVALSEENDSVVEVALAAVQNLAIHDTAVMMVSKPDLVLVLKNHLLSNAPETEASAKSKSHASATLLVLERSITPDMGQPYKVLQDLLEAVNPTKSSEDTNSSSISEATDDIVAV